ncbi:hypothetical protein V6N11_016170 [Hibiscus sabdariffa]|uniref:Uncharacterized protein n=1 Tax=Hibiscus sabdariffa TaxID=183260 RepID=A0ABR2TUP3_9ROSI
MANSKPTSVCRPITNEESKAANANPHVPKLVILLCSFFRTATPVSIIPPKAAKANLTLLSCDALPPAPATCRHQITLSRENRFYPHEILHVSYPKSRDVAIRMRRSRFAGTPRFSLRVVIC